MKSYQECEQSVNEEIKRAMDGWTDGKEFFSNRMIGFLKAKCVELTYEIELMRAQAEIRGNVADTREMHALLERLGGK